MRVNERGECELHEIFPATSCTYCNPPAKPTPTVSTFDVEYPFMARLYSTCAECDRVCVPGDDMAHLTDGRNVCGDCVGME